MKRIHTSLKTLTTFFIAVITIIILYGQELNANNSGYSAYDPMGTAIPAKKFFAVTVDNNNTKWFLTESGIVSYDGSSWILHDKNLQGKDLRDIAFDAGIEGTGFWIATGSGISSLKAPVSDGSSATSLTSDNASLLSNNVVKVVVGKNNLKWIGTNKGISAYTGSKWLDISYDDLYPSMIFEEYPITSMATNQTGDSLYVATKGAGVARVYKNDVDGISGASVIAQWGPIIIPSDNVFSVYIEKNGVRWFGTDMGVASHFGNNALENWVVYTTEEGLVNDFVQSIFSDQKGNLWFGTQAGISVFDGKSFTNYTKENGLNSNNILCIITDKNGVVWIGTDDGVNSFSNGTFTSYR